MTRKLLTVEEIAEHLGVSKMTVYRLIHARELPALKVGRSFRVKPDDLDLYMERVRTDGGARD